ncbi:DISARM system phospholipase D-like protein DrmC [Demequina sp. SYSU T00039]|uniref:phospholipase D n=1 Tax=Demequina lignilytica TaxID=3051663 RepID=A0AAW7M8Z6_9MICO|nr:MULTISPECIES: DISARM system phospholipase D-like protein DrmC [unclassified Demequina]MDN4477303.1 DISARM system phospholipase D-like protein DrmC [Demequina sp. SYSU T00039-1]MDN4487476.1 DISARM system phospholipase D-like protein DrmC [Demequina sp. SYSU T00039]
MADPFVELASALSPALAVKIASGLEIDGRLSKAAAKLPSDSPAVSALGAAFEAVGPVALAGILRGFATAADANGTDIRAVWSGPTFDGDGDHTTSALAHLIDSAADDVFASTFSATRDSAFVDALWRAVARGIRTTLLVDSKVKNGEVAAMLQERLAGARFWTYVHPDGGYAAQHSKAVLVDSRSAFVTSANFSDAAAHRNLEAGVIIHDAAFASGMRQRFNRLWEAGAVSDLE